MFTVFGATGNTGSIVAQRLLAAGKKVRVAVRDPGKVADLAKAGAEVVRIDLADAASVAKALDGAEGAYVLVPPDLSSTDLVGRGAKISAAYASALRGSSVKHVVALSSVGADVERGTGPIVIARGLEQALAGTGVKSTFIRAPYFMENLLGYAHPMKSDGVLPVFGGGEAHPFPMIATKDIGETAAAALLAPPAASEIVELSGPSAYSYADAAAVASKILGRTVKPLVLPIDALVPALTKVGMSANVAGLFREMTEAFGSGRVRQLGSGRSVAGTTPLEDVLRPALAG